MKNNHKINFMKIIIGCLIFTCITATIYANALGLKISENIPRDLLIKWDNGGSQLASCYLPYASQGVPGRTQGICPKGMIYNKHLLPLGYKYDISICANSYGMGVGECLFNARQQNQPGYPTDIVVNLASSNVTIQQKGFWSGYSYSQIKTTLTINGAASIHTKKNAGDTTTNTSKNLTGNYQLSIQTD